MSWATRKVVRFVLIWLWSMKRYTRTAPWAAGNDDNDSVRCRKLVWYDILIDDTIISGPPRCVIFNSIFFGGIDRNRWQWVNDRVRCRGTTLNCCPWLRTLEICYAKGGKIPVLVIMAKDFGVPQWLQHVLGRINIFTIYELAADTQYGNLYWTWAAPV